MQIPSNSITFGLFMESGVLRAGEAIALVDRQGRRYIKILRTGHRITIRGSVIKADSLIGRSEGSLIGSKKEYFRVFRPTLAELLPQIPRSAEPLFSKDIGVVLTRGDIMSGQRLLELGVGAGALSMALLRVIGPSGSLVSYEARADLAQHACSNVERFWGETPNWTVKVRNADDGFDERDVDRVITDIPEPQRLLGCIAQALRPGGILICYLPTVLQIRDLHEALRVHPLWGSAQTWELLERSWHVDPPSVRPDQRMVGHTGFVTVVRRLAP
ncbi:MAG: tRNA (adenine-N1)-methyltransferase [Candidatus Binatia bacterium]